MSKKIKEFTLINLGIIMVACGMYFFLMSNNLATGGGKWSSHSYQSFYS